MTRPLGSVQKSVLDSLRRHRTFPGGWYWDTHSNTVRVLDSLVNRGLVTKTGEGRRAVYTVAAGAFPAGAKR